eukprot:3930394-Pleurochrysis_carterae.AAC.1
MRAQAVAYATALLPSCCRAGRCCVKEASVASLLVEAQNRDGKERLCFVKFAKCWASCGYKYSNG